MSERDKWNEIEQHLLRAGLILADMDPVDLPRDNPARLRQLLHEAIERSAELSDPREWYGKMVALNNRGLM